MKFEHREISIRDIECSNGYYHEILCPTCPYRHRCDTGVYLITEARDMAIMAKAEHLYYIKSHINQKYQEYWDWKMWNWGYSTEAGCFINSADYKRFIDDIMAQAFSNDWYDRERR